MSDEATLEAIRQRLLETGDWERISQILRSKLEESGFDDELKDLAKEKARKQVAPSLSKLVADVTPAANELVSKAVRESVVREIEKVLEREVERA